jgi:enoyl-CoA hydratase/carnithine racemase
MATVRIDKSRTAVWIASFHNPPDNRVTPEMILELQAIVTQLEQEGSVRVVIFDSANDDVFLGPYDLSRAADTPNDAGPTGMPTWLDLTARLSRLPTVSIAKIRGATRGVGSEFALACDMRFASLERARIDQPETSARVVPGGGAIARLPGLAGRARTLEIILGSITLSGALADHYGVVNRAVPDAELDAFVDDLADRIAGFDGQVISESKALIDEATLPEDDRLLAPYHAFFGSVARLVAASTPGG